MIARVFVTLKPAVLDAQGQTVQREVDILARRSGGHRARYAALLGLGDSRHHQSVFLKVAQDNRSG